MKILALDGQYAGQHLDYLPDGYRVIMHFDGYPDVATCQPDYDRRIFIADVMSGVEIFADHDTAVRVVNHMNQGRMLVLGKHIVKLMCETNDILFDLCRVRLQ